MMRSTYPGGAHVDEDQTDDYDSAGRCSRRHLWTGARGRPHTFSGEGRSWAARAALIVPPQCWRRS